MRSCLATLVGCILLSLLAVGSVEGAAFTVIGTADTGGTCPTPSTCASLRQAINSANANTADVPPHNIDFVSTLTGTITLGSTLPTPTRNININAPTLSLVVHGGGNRIFNFTTAGKTVSISGLNLTGGRAADGAAMNITAGTLNLFRSALYGNYATATGGAVRNSGGTVNMTNVTLSSNQARTNGGAVRNQTGTMTFNNVTITQNTADADGNGTGAGGGIIINAGTVNVRNSIIAGNTNNAGGGTPDCSGALTSQDFNLFLPLLNPGCTVGGVAANPINNFDPLLGPLQDNGGITLTHALLTGSPAIDMGNTLTPGSGGFSCDGTDQRGVTRPQGSFCDIGAYEYELSGVAEETDLSVIKVVTSPSLVNVGDSVSYSITVTNNGSGEAADVRLRDSFPGAALSVTSVTPSIVGACGGGPFSSPIVCDFGSLPSGESATISVTAIVTDCGTIANTATGSSLTTIDPDPTNNTSVEIIVAGGGCGITNPIATASPVSLAFDSVVLGEQADRMVQLTNTGTSPLTILDPPSISGSGDFSILDETCGPLGMLAVNQSCFILIQYSPSTLGIVGGSLDFSDDGGSPSVLMSGIGVAAGVPVMDLSETTLNFVSAAVETPSDPEIITLTNTGTADLNVNSVFLSGLDAAEFAVSEDLCSGRVLAPGDQCSFTLIFTPAGDNVFVALVSITANEPTLFAVLNLTGEIEHPIVPGVGDGPDVQGGSGGCSLFRHDARGFTHRIEGILAGLVLFLFLRRRSSSSM